MCILNNDDQSVICHRLSATFRLCWLWWEATLYKVVKLFPSWMRLGRGIYNFHHSWFMKYKIQCSSYDSKKKEKISRYWKAFSEHDPNNCLLFKIQFQLQNWTLFDTIWDHYRLKYTEIQSNKWISHYVQQWSMILRFLPTI